jgi:hypothetical protein
MAEYDSGLRFALRCLEKFEKLFIFLSASVRYEQEKIGGMIRDLRL